uniref:Uncharacterized protein n=1 Tax=viral metagenome TaxID=1070528 RepID=A0A6M3LT35_9ZZZZ
MIPVGFINRSLVGPRKVGGTWSAASAWTLPAVTLGGAVSLSGVVGIDYNPGSDADTDIITVGVTGAPRVYWDESTSLIRSNIGIASDDHFAVIHSTNPYLSLQTDDSTTKGYLQYSVNDVNLTSTGAVSVLIDGGSTDDEGVTIRARDIDGSAWVNVIRVQNANAVELGFFAATPVAKQTGCLVPTDLTTSIAAITALRTALNNYGLTTVET